MKQSLPRFGMLSNRFISDSMNWVWCFFQVQVFRQTMPQHQACTTSGLKLAAVLFDLCWMFLKTTSPMITSCWSNNQGAPKGSGSLVEGPNLAGNASCLDLIHQWSNGQQCEYTCRWGNNIDFAHINPINSRKIRFGVWLCLICEGKMIKLELDESSNRQHARNMSKPVVKKGRKNVQISCCQKHMIVCNFTMLSIQSKQRQTMFFQQCASTTEHVTKNFEWCIFI